MSAAVDVGATIDVDDEVGDGDGAGEGIVGVNVGMRVGVGRVGVQVGVTVGVGVGARVYRRRVGMAVGDGSPWQVEFARRATIAKPSAIKKNNGLSIKIASSCRATSLRDFG